MTAQIGDKFYYKGNRYEFVSLENEIKFHPRDLGLTPMGCCTCCWRGHWCEYEISPEGLFLQNLFICTMGDNYPDVDGVKVLGEKSVMGCSVYPNLNKKVSYNGKLIVGTDFLREYYIHAGYQRPWAYKTVLEFSFEDGKMVAIKDISSKMQEIREKYPNDRHIPWTVWIEAIEGNVREEEE